MAIAVCHFNPFSIYFQVLTTYFSLLRQQTQCQNIKEDSELDFIHTLFKKMSHPEFNKYQQLLYDTLLYHTLTIYIQRESNRCFLCSVIFLHSISRVTLCKLKSHQILHEKNGLCFQWTHMAQWYFNSFYDTALILTFAGSVLPVHVCSSTWCRCGWGKHPLPQELLCFAHTKKLYELHSWIWPIQIELKPKSGQIFYNWRTWHKINSYQFSNLIQDAKH